MTDARYFLNDQQTLGSGERTKSRNFFIKEERDGLPGSL